MWYSIRAVSRTSDLLGLQPGVWEWGRKQWEEGVPAALPEFVGWSKEEWVGWIERERRRQQAGEGSVEAGV